MVNFAWRRRQRARNTRNRAALGLIAATAMVVVPWYQARAQNPDSARFDVVSVKRNQLEPRARRPVFGCSAGRFVSQGGTYTGRGILWAFDVDATHLIDAPEWAMSSAGEVYDIEAKTTKLIDEHECKLMVQNLFAERFKLVSHREEREVPVFALVVTAKGIKAQKVPDGQTIPNGPGFVINGHSMQMFDPSLPGWTMQQLADALAVANLGRPVMDKTGLTGLYKINLSFRQRGTDGEAPEATTALEEQLGLHLEARRERDSVVVIDHLGRPDPN